MIPATSNVAHTMPSPKYASGDELRARVERKLNKTWSIGDRIGREVAC